MRRRLSQWDGPWGRWRAGPGVRLGLGADLAGVHPLSAGQRVRQPGGGDSPRAGHRWARWCSSPPTSGLSSPRGPGGRDRTRSPRCSCVLIAVACRADAGRPPELGLPVHLLRCVHGLRGDARAGVRRGDRLHGAGRRSLRAGRGVRRDRPRASSPARSGIGLLMLLMRDLRVRNEELTHARAELARLAVAEERERFARDLHDLLGHTLSVIALKAELAGRLLPDRPGSALSARSPTSKRSPATRSVRFARRSAATGSRPSTASWPARGWPWTRPGSRRSSSGPRSRLTPRSRPCWRGRCGKGRPT